MNTNQSDFATFGFLLLTQAGLIAYVWYCVRHGYIWVRLERIEKRRKPREFKWTLRTFIIFEAFFLAFVLYHLVVSALKL